MSRALYPAPPKVFFLPIILLAAACPKEPSAPETLIVKQVLTLESGADGLSDLERLGSKIVMGQCNARDLLALKRSLQHLPEFG